MQPPQTNARGLAQRQCPLSQVNPVGQSPQVPAQPSSPQILRSQFGVQIGGGGTGGGGLCFFLCLVWCLAWTSWSPSAMARHVISPASTRRREAPETRTRLRPSNCRGSIVGTSPLRVAVEAERQDGASSPSSGVLLERSLPPG